MSHSPFHNVFQSNASGPGYLRIFDRNMRSSNSYDLTNSHPEFEFNPSGCPTARSECRRAMDDGDDTSTDNLACRDDHDYPNITHLPVVTAGSGIADLPETLVLDIQIQLLRKHLDPIGVFNNHPEIPNGSVGRLEWTMTIAPLLGILPNVSRTEFYTGVYSSVIEGEVALFHAATMTKREQRNDYVLYETEDIPVVADTSPSIRDLIHSIRFLPSNTSNPPIDLSINDIDLTSIINRPIGFDNGGRDFFSQLSTHSIRYLFSIQRVAHSAVWNPSIVNPPLFFGGSSTLGNYEPGEAYVALLMGVHLNCGTDITYHGMTAPTVWRSRNLDHFTQPNTNILYILPTFYGNALNSVDVEASFSVGGSRADYILLPQFLNYAAAPFSGTPGASIKRLSDEFANTLVHKHIVAGESGCDLEDGCFANPLAIPATIRLS